MAGERPRPSDWAAGLVDQRRIWIRPITTHPVEGATALRRFYLYAATLFSAAVAVTPAAMLLSDILRRIFGYPSACR